MSDYLNCSWLSCIRFIRLLNEIEDSSFYKYSSEELSFFDEERILFDSICGSIDSWLGGFDFWTVCHCRV